MENFDLNEVLDTLYDYNFKLIDAISSVVEDFRGQNETKALNLLVEAVEGLEWSISVSLNIKEVFGQYGFKIDENHLPGILRELVQAMENADYVLLPDLLEYEILEFLKDCQACLEKILQFKQ